jgi:hypothetical protein
LGAGEKLEDFETHVPPELRCTVPPKLRDLIKSKKYKKKLGHEIHFFLSYFLEAKPSKNISKTDSGPQNDSRAHKNSVE